MTSANAKSDKPKLTKRQKRKMGPNPSNTWQQQPKIKSAEARTKAYIRNAGFTLSSTKSSKPSQNPISPDADFINSAEFKFGRLLASPVARTRHATILKLKEYLKARTDPTRDNCGLSLLDLMKLWKGMWHTLYLCDGVMVQEEVSKALTELIWAVGGTQEEDEYAGRFYLEMEEGGTDGMIDEVGNSSQPKDDNDDLDSVEDDDDEMQIVEMDDDGDENEDPETGEMQEIDAVNPAEEEDTKHCRGAHLSALYVRTYFRTLAREWSNMDKYRIDKFYTLTRLMLREIYRYMASRHWNLGIIRLFNDGLFEEVLRTSTFGNGVRFHVLDICLEELAKVNSENLTGLQLTEATFLDCLEPYFAMAQRVEDKLVHSRVMENVIQRFLDEYSVVSSNYDPVEDAEAKRKLVMSEVHVGTVAQFIFELGSDEETADRYRKKLYDMHKTYMKRIKAVGRDVNLEVGGDDDVEENEQAGDEDIGATEDDDVTDMALDNVDVNVVSEESTPEVIQPEIKKSKKKKKKKSKKKEATAAALEDETQPLEETPTDTKENKELTEETAKKEVSTPKKKRKKKRKAEQSINLSAEEEEVITISKKEQKAAAKAVSKAAKAASKAANAKADEKTNEDKTSLLNSAKKVKFGKTNTAKSYKASMKDLNRLDPKSTLVKTPDKGILLSKRKSSHKKRKS